MSLSISFTDLELITALQHMSETAMLSIENDEAISNQLYTIGFDTSKPVCYLPGQHRNLQGKIVIGFRAVGEVRRDREFKNSFMASMVDRLTIVAYEDVSLMKQLAELTVKSRNFLAYGGDEHYEAQKNDTTWFPSDQLEPDWKEVSEQIRELEMLRDRIRGPMNSEESGGLKSMKEYMEFFNNQIKGVNEK